MTEKLLVTSIYIQMIETLLGSDSKALNQSLISGSRLTVSSQNVQRDITPTKRESFVPSVAVTIGQSTVKLCTWSLQPWARVLTPPAIAPGTPAAPSG